MNKIFDIRLFSKPVILISVLLIVFSISVYVYHNKNPTTRNIGDNINTIPEGYGVNIHFKGHSINDINLIKNARIKIVRTDLFWSDIEQSPGEYRFSEYDKLVDDLVKSGIRPYLILDYSNTLYEKNNSIVSEKGKEAFVNYVKQATSRYKNHNIIWEIWNEPNVTWKSQTSYEDYANLVKAVSTVIKQNDPSGVVVAPALASLNQDSLNWLEQLFKRGLLDEIDAVSVHPYRGSPPETVASDYHKLNQLIKKYSNKNIPILSGEWGYSTGNGWFGLHLTEIQQAEYVVRSFLLNEWQHVPVSIWYDWKDDGVNPNNGEYNFGLRKNNLDSKPDYVSLKVLTKFLSGYKFESKIDLGNQNDYVLKFSSKAGDKVIVYWTVSSPHQFDLTGKNISGSIFSMFGEYRGEFQKKGKLQISSSPNYLIMN